MVPVAARLPVQQAGLAGQEYGVRDVHGAELPVQTQCHLGDGLLGVSQVLGYGGVRLTL
jgi:hypothetical protein